MSVVEIAQPGVRRINRPAMLFWFVLLLIGAAELVTAVVQPHLGLLMHAALLIGLLITAGRARHADHRNLALALCAAPLVRLMAVSLPLNQLPQLAWYPAVGVPLLAVIWLIARQTGLGRDELGLRPGNLPVELALIAGGFTLGTVEYMILKPELPFDVMNGWMFLLAALSFLLFTGLTEELLFRGVLQRLAPPVMGSLGLIFVSLLFGVMHIGHLSFFDVVFVTLVALVFAYIVRAQGSIIGVTFAHGLTNLTLFVIMPWLHRDRPDLISWFVWGPLAVGTALWVWAMGFLAARSALNRLRGVSAAPESLEQTAARASLRSLLREHRRARQLDFHELAARTGLTSRRLAAIEVGLAQASSAERLELARALGIPAQMLDQTAEDVALAAHAHV